MKKRLTLSQRMRKQRQAERRAAIAGNILIGAFALSMAVAFIVSIHVNFGG